MRLGLVKKLSILALLALLAMSALGCHTLRGVTRDVAGVGKAIKAILPP